ncbi:MAG: NAD-dependent epimerase/dehydratase family protein [Pirellulales bacterium]
MTFDWRSRRVLIAGGLGFIGSHLVEYFSAESACVTVIDALIPGSGGRRENVPRDMPGVTIHLSDLRCEDAVASICEGQEFIFFLAGQTGHSESMQDPLNDLEHNCRSLLSVLELLRKRQLKPLIVYASTRQLYGRVDRLPVDESTPVRPTDINGIHKFAAESYLRLAAECYGIPSIVLRLTNTFGPRMNVVGGSGVMPVFLRRMLQGRPVLVYGDGSQRRDFNYVSDVTAAFASAATAAPSLPSDIPHAVFNLGHPCTYSLNDVVRALQRIGPLVAECVPFPGEAAAIDIGDFQGDFRAFQAFSGWQPRVDLQLGLELTLQALNKTDSCKPVSVP